MGRDIAALNMPKRPKVEPIRQPTLFELDQPPEHVNQPGIDRPFSLPGTNIFLGTSAFTASGWEGSFYPPGMRSRDFLSMRDSFKQSRSTARFMARQAPRL
jgi:hypothetical protein